MLRPDLIEWLFFEDPEALNDRLLEVAASVNATILFIFKDFSKIEDPFEFDEIAECLYSLKVLDEFNASIQNVKIYNPSLQITRTILRMTMEYSKNLVKSAQNELMRSCIDLYHVIYHV